MSVGDHVTLTDGVRFITHDGGVWVFRNEQPDIDVVGRIQIHENVFVGLGAILLPDIEIGPNAVIAARSYIERPPGSTERAHGVAIGLGHAVVQVEEFAYEWGDDMAGPAPQVPLHDDAGMVRHRRDEPRTFRLLYVCTGNICRSPFAEILTRQILLDRLGGPAAAAFHISSAGVHAVAGASIHPDTREELGPWALDRSAAGRFVARQLRPVMVEQSDLILGADRRHRSAVVECSPAALATAFSLREFARLAASVDPAVLPADPVARARALVEHALGRRGMVPPAGPDEDQVPDPMGGLPQAHHAAAVLIQEAVESIVDIIAPAVGRTR